MQNEHLVRLLTAPNWDCGLTSVMGHLIEKLGQSSKSSLARLAA